MAVNFLEGLKVLDLGQGISAPFCAKMFADLGAQVIKVEPTGGDISRTMGPFPGDVPDREQSGMFLALNTNKLGVQFERHFGFLDLQESPEGHSRKARETKDPLCEGRPKFNVSR